ncbi:spore germination protein [Fictibacillus gelatini]|uniref:spore germination protein n=1 Tax=Fictibacillus gelatini TaxID=225985 RepID=UPI0003FD5612|nr:spore germination protein [Fictibacillus gelatini]
MVTNGERGEFSIFFFRFLKYKRYSSYQKTQPSDHQVQQDSRKDRPISSQLSVNIEELHRLFHQAPDLVIRNFNLANSKVKAALVYLDGLSDKNSISNNVLRSLMQISFDPEKELPTTVGDVKVAHTWNFVENSLFEGASALFIDGETKVFLLDTKGWAERAIEDPQLETSLKGAHQGFVETGSQNVAMLRRYIPNRELVIKEITVGVRGKSKVYIAYLADVASQEVLQELEDRIRQIQMDTIINTGELAEFIEDNPFSPFPQFILTERPDAAASQILQGRFTVIVDRSPAVLIAPATLMSFIQSVDDYSTRWIAASFIRLLRLFAFMITLFLPATYVAVISFNYEVIPLQLFLSIAESRSMVPFPPILEALLMEVTIEMMREAGVRLPAPMGQTVGIVGGIVVGQAAVQAGVVSNIMVIIVAATAIASFIIPSYDMGTAVRLLRFPMIMLAALFGITGIMISFMTILGHIISLESLGTPYSSPLAPFRFSDMKDSFIRFPLWKMVIRPKSVRTIQANRQGNSRKQR